MLQYLLFSLSVSSLQSNIPTSLQYFSVFAVCAIFYLTIFQQAYNISLCPLSVLSSVRQYSNNPTIFYSVHSLCHPPWDHIPTGLQYLTLFAVVLSFSYNIPNATISYPVHCCAFFLWQYSNRTTISYPVHCCAFFLWQYSKCHNILPCLLSCFLSLTIFQMPTISYPVHCLCYPLVGNIPTSLKYFTMLNVCTILCRTIFQHA